MTLQDFGSLGELIAAIATIATLAYLALQIRGANQAPLLGAVQHNYDSLNEFCDAILRSSEVASIVLKGRRAYADLDEIERMRFDHVHLRLLNTVESWHFQIQETATGGYRKEQLEDIAATVRVYFDHPGVREWWERNDVRFDDAIQDLIEASRTQPTRGVSAV